MAKTLTLKDGTQYACAVTSTITSIIIPASDFAEVGAIYDTLTPENLSECNLDGVPYTDVILEGVTASMAGGIITATFSCRMGINDRIEAERQAAVDEYTMQLIEEGVL